MFGMKVCPMSANRPAPLSVTATATDAATRAPAGWRWLARLAACLCLALIAVPGLARAQLNVTVTEGLQRPLQLAVDDFAGPHGAEMAAVIRADLERSGLFDVAAREGLVQTGIDVNVAPAFNVWQGAGTQALVVGRGVVRDGRLSVEFRLWDVFGESQMLGLEFGSAEENWRRIAHKIADAIYERLTGVRGHFDTRIVFVAETGPRTNRIKRLAIMDQDGAEPTYLTDGSEQILSPRFDAQGQQIVYSAMTEAGVTVWVLDIASGRREAVTGPERMAFAPRFSPDGGSILYSADRDGNVDLFVKNLRTGALRRLSEHPAIDTSPDMSPDGRQIVFTSDRGGTSQIYRMNADGSGVRRLSFGAGRYSTAVWSPDGSMIAFTRQAGGRFQIGVMNSDGGGERVLAESWLVEGPSWSPNGRVVVFQRESGPGAQPALWSVDVSGGNLRPIPWQAAGSDPAWSPTLP